MPPVFALAMIGADLELGDTTFADSAVAAHVDHSTKLAAKTCSFPMRRSTSPM